MTRWWPPLPLTTNSRPGRGAGPQYPWPSASQQRRPPRTMASTMARSRHRRSDAISASTSVGSGSTITWRLRPHNQGVRRTGSTPVRGEGLRPRCNHRPCLGRRTGTPEMDGNPQEAWPDAASCKAVHANTAGLQRRTTDTKRHYCPGAMPRSRLFCCRPNVVSGTGSAMARLGERLGNLMTVGHLQSRRPLPEGRMAPFRGRLCPRNCARCATYCRSGSPVRPALQAPRRHRPCCRPADPLRPLEAAKEPAADSLGDNLAFSLNGFDLGGAPTLSGKFHRVRPHLGEPTGSLGRPNP